MSRPCLRCRRPIKDESPYFARQIGPVCGGILHIGKAGTVPVAPKIRGRVTEAAEGQLDLLGELVAEGSVTT